MKRSLSFESPRATLLVAAGCCLIAGTYGLVRLAYGLFLPDIQAAVSMSSSVAGYVGSGASVAYCAGAVAGLLAPDRARLLIVGALSTALLGAVGMAVAPGMALLVPSVIVGSASAGLASPGLVAMVARNISASDADRAQESVNAGTGPGLVAAGVLALAVSDWRAGFAIGATFTALAGALVLALDGQGRLPADPGTTPAQSGTTPTVAASDAASESDAVTPDTDAPRATGRPWLVSLRWPLAGALALGASSITVWTYGRAHLVASGASDAGSIVAWMAVGVGGTATLLTARRLSAVPAARAWMITTLAVAAGTAGFVAASPPALALTASAVFGWGFVAATSALISWTGRLTPSRQAAGTSAAFIALVLGQAAGSAVAGALSEGVGMPATFAIAAVAAAAAATCGWPDRAPSRTAGEAASRVDA